MTPLAPSVNGTVTSYAVSPALPAGITMDAATGVISGTPSSSAPYNAYVVTASNATGEVRADVPIQIVSNLYPSAAYTFTVGVAARTINPTQNSVAPASWSVSPDLPPGLALDSSKGAITGTPTVAAPRTSYVVSTSTTGGGTSTQTVALTVVASPLVDLGHAVSVSFARFNQASLLTQDGGGHWVLSDYATGKNLANGQAAAVVGPMSQPLPVDLEGTSVVVQTSSGLEVRSAADGHVLSEIATTPSWWKLASDGSYVCAGSSSGLTAWSPSGGVLLTRTGNYSNANVFAAPSQIQIALGAAGTNLIETVSMPGGTSSLGAPFSGQFQSWFVDGDRFLTATNTTVWVYSSSSAQQDLASLPTVNQLTGQGNWYWTVTTTGSPILTLYAVGSGGTATATYPVYSPPIPGVGQVEGIAVASGSTAAILTEGSSGGMGQVTVVDLSGASPVATTSNTPIEQLSAYAAASSSTWIVGNSAGVLFDGASTVAQPRYLDYGRATGIAGGLNNVAIATASGRIVYFEATTLAQQGTLDQLAWQIATSSDGTVLAAASGGSSYSATQPPLSITVYSLPGGSVTHSFSTPTLNLMDLSGSGTVLGETFYTAAPCLSQAFAIASATTLWCSSSAVGLALLSPDGTLLAVPVPGSTSSPPPTTNIYQNGTLVTALAATALAWLDNNTVLANIIAFEPSMANPNGFVYTGAAIYDSTGHLQSSPAIPQLGPVQVLSSTSVYDGGSNAIYSLTTGAATWASGSPFTSDLVQPPTGSPPMALSSAVSGSYVVFESSNLILAEPY
jgi:hypothetical protein